MVQSIIQPKKPTGKGWILGPDVPAFISRGFPLQSWQFLKRGLCVFSAVEVVTPELGEEELGPEYHLSISRNGTARCTSQEAKWVLRQFGLEDAEEDNHVPHGITRHFWRPVADRLSGYECPCKSREPAICEDKGDFVWRGVTQ